ncbi:cobyrinate a,c-diamide synthase [Nocardia sp. NPDC127579]|uniref:cobyrinate a,c-diamide synthase n=1 Tax=Nocardia sp. NPDC127579 TaxID=3345402 RepID=UPI003640856B
MIAAPASGSGKTTLATGLIGALRRAGHRVAPFKVGPDYIDPGYHGLAAGRPGRNLDPVLVGAQRVVPLYRHGVRGCDLAVVEGVMGLFDGRIDENQVAPVAEGSTAQVAALLGAPVVLVVDARGHSQSLAALLHGFATFDSGIRLGGVILNRVGSERHDQVLRAACARVGLPVLGSLPRMPELEVPSRHLGLIPAVEHGSAATAAVAAMTDLVAAHVDLSAIARLAHSTATGDPWDPSDAVRAVFNATAPVATHHSNEPVHEVATPKDSTLRTATPEVATPRTVRSEDVTPEDAAPVDVPEVAAVSEAAVPAVVSGVAVPEAAVPAVASGVAVSGAAVAAVVSGVVAPRTVSPAGGQQQVGGDGDTALFAGQATESFVVPDQSQSVGAASGISHRSSESVGGPSRAFGTSRGGPVIAMAGGPAFTFGYAEHRELLVAAGAEVVVFDPLRDELPEGAAGLVLPGGFPEEHAADLAANAGLLKTVGELARRGLPIHAECAGLLYLTRSLDGHAMAGVLDADAEFGPRLTLGYRDAVALADSVLWRAGERVRGHEFHRTRLIAAGTAPAAWGWHGSQGERVREGSLITRVHASYLHTHPAGNPLATARFVTATEQYAGHHVVP